MARPRFARQQAPEPSASTSGVWRFDDVAVMPPGHRPALGGADDAAEIEANRLAAHALGLPPSTSRTTMADPAHGRVSPRTAAAIDAVNRQPGRPLPSALGGTFGRRFGFDFSAVRIHDSTTANRAASSVGASAYSFGTHLVFAPHEYAPSTLRGQALLAHELAHVVQHTRAGGAPVVRRSLLGTVVGGTLGGAALGGLLGKLGSMIGPWGGLLGVVGAVGGAALGAWLGDKASTKRRPLTDAEKATARGVYAASVDLDKVELQRGSLLSGGNTPRTAGNLISFPDSYYKDDTMDLTPHGSLTLMHELGHVWQYQHGGTSYIESSLVPQGVAGSRGLSRSVAYNWRNAEGSGIAWERWNAEQQAQCISDYHAAKTRLAADAYTEVSKPSRMDDIDTVTRAEPFIAKVQAGVGAVGSTPDTST